MNKCDLLKRKKCHVTLFLLPKPKVEEEEKSS